MTEQEEKQVKLKKQREKILHNIDKIDGLEICPRCNIAVSVKDGHCPRCQLKFDNGTWQLEKIEKKKVIDPTEKEMNDDEEDALDMFGIFENE